MKKILVPTDFSDPSLHAALYAAETARKSGAVIYFIHVPGAAQDRMFQLETFRNAVTDVYTDIKTEVALPYGTTVDGIIDFCNHNAFDLIVMGTKGASGLKEVFIGSTTANVIAKTRIPVLAIPATYVMEEPDALLFTTSHFEKNIALLNSIVEIAILYSATIHVVVFEDKETVKDATHAINSLQLQQYLEFLKNTFPGVSFKAELLQGTSFEGAVELYYLKNGADIIAMVTYPKGFWARMLHQSMTQKMTFHAHIPVLAIPANAGTVA